MHRSVFYYLTLYYMKMYNISMSTTSRAVGSTVRAEMARSKVTQAQIAEVLGITQQSVSSRLAGRVAFNVEELQVVADHLGVPATALLPQPVSA